MKITKKTLLSSVLSASFAFVVCINLPVTAAGGAGQQYAAVNMGNVVQTISPDVQIDWSNNVIKVTGTGAPPDRGNSAQKRLMAQRAAKADAYRQLLEVINGVHVTSETVVKDFVTESDVIKTQVEGLVRGAEQVGDVRYMSDGSVEIDMQIKLFGKDNSIASIVMPKEESKADNPPTKLQPAPSIEENYTSVIVDCKGLGSEPAMSPAIFDQNGGEVYVGNLPVNPDFVINVGIVSYENSLTEAKKNSRAGVNPLIIKGLKVNGLFKSDITISNADAQKLLGANNKTKFLENSKVIFLL